MTDDVFIVFTRSFVIRVIRVRSLCHPDSSSWMNKARRVLFDQVLWTTEWCPMCLIFDQFILTGSAKQSHDSVHRSPSLIRKLITSLCAHYKIPPTGGSTWIKSKKIFIPPPRSCHKLSQTTISNNEECCVNFGLCVQ